MPISIATINLAAYESLDPVLRAAVDQADVATEAAQWLRIRSRLEKNYTTMRSNGVAIDTKVSPAVMEALREASSGTVRAGRRWSERMQMNLAGFGKR